MPKFTISNKSETSRVTIRIATEDAGDLMRILARNEVPFILHGNAKGENNGNQNSNR